MKYTLHIAFDGKFGDIILRVDERVKQFGQAEAPAYKPLLFTPNGNGFNVRRPEKSCKTAEAIAYMIDWRAGLALEWLGKNTEENLKDGDAITDFIEKEYIRNVTVDSPFDPELHIMLYVPLYKSEAVEFAERLIKDLPVSYKIVVNVIALPYDVAEATEMLDTKIDRIERNKIMRKSMKDLLKLRETYESFRYILFFQNRNIDGWSINYNREKLICTLSDIAVNLIANYHDVAKYIEENKPVLIINSQSYVLDIYYAFNKWISGLFVKEADNHILSEDDDDEAKKEADKIFLEITKQENQVVKDFIAGLKLSSYEYSIDELEKAFKTDCGEKIKQIIEEECKDKPISVRHQLYKKFQNVGGLSKEDTEETIAEALEQDRLFIENLTVGDDLKKAYAKLENLLKDIRKLRIQIEKEQIDVEELKKQISDEDYEFAEISDDVIKFGEQIYNSDPLDDVNLPETYVPDTDEQLPENVDLSKNFLPVKHQGGQGACGPFSIVSVYEYFLKCITNKNTSLSEAFVYYNARKLAGDGKENKNVGTCRPDLIKAASEFGFCLSEFCPYDNRSKDAYKIIPSIEAYDDGKNRLVTEAKDVQINIDHIKDALAKGYPVLISVKLMTAVEAITKNDGFIRLNDYKDKAKLVSDPEKDNHAMVICGYYKDGFFKVRNSWGETFGDKGYLYLPFEMFRNKEYINWCYIITGIKDGTLENLTQGLDEPNKLKANTKAGEFELILNKILEKEYAIKSNRTRLSQISDEYSQLCRGIGEREVAIQNIEEIDRQIEELRHKKSYNDSFFNKLRGRVSNDPRLAKLIFDRNTSLLSFVIINGIIKLNKQYLEQAGVIEVTSDILTYENDVIKHRNNKEKDSYYRTISPKNFKLDEFLSSALSQESLSVLFSNAKNAISDVCNNKIGLYEVFGALSQGLHDYVLKNLGVTILDYLDDERGIQFFNSINHSSIMAMIEGWVPQGAGNDVIHLTMPTDNPQIGVKLSESINMLVSTDIYRITFLHVERYSTDEISLFALVPRLITEARVRADKEKQPVNTWINSNAGRKFLNDAEAELTYDEFSNLTSKLTTTN